MTRDQMAACLALDKEGMISVPLPYGPEVPIPGLILMTDRAQRQLVIVKPDGTIVDLLKVYELAETCIRDWQKGSSLPGFVGDFKRLTPLAQALNGRPVDGERKS